MSFPETKRKEKKIKKRIRIGDFFVILSLPHRPVKLSENFKTIPMGQIFSLFPSP